MKVRAIGGYLLIVGFVLAQAALFLFFSSDPVPPTTDASTGVSCRIKVPHTKPPGLTSNRHTLDADHPSSLPPSASQDAAVLDANRGQKDSNAPDVETPQPSPRPKGPALPVGPSDNFFFRLQGAGSYSVFGTVPLSQLLTSSVTEAVCECFDGSCTLHMTHVVLKRITSDWLVFRPLEGGHSKDTLQKVLYRCRNAFRLCDAGHPSPFCNPGITYGVSTKRHSRASYDGDGQHVLVTLRALRGELYHDLIAPRGLLLNYAMANLSRAAFCAPAALVAGTPPPIAPSPGSCSLKTSAVWLMSDERSRTAGVLTPTSYGTLRTLEDLLGFPEAQYLHKNMDRSARHLSVGNRVVSFEGRHFEAMVAGLQRLRASAGETRAAAAIQHGGGGNADGAARKEPLKQKSGGGDAAGTSPPAEPSDPDAAAVEVAAMNYKPTDATAADAAHPVGPLGLGVIHMLTGPTVTVHSRLRGGLSKDVQDTLAARLLAATQRAVVTHGMAAIAAMPLADIVRWTTNASFIVCEEGSFLAFLAFARPGTTWLAVAEYTVAQHLDTVRFHLRTWLLNPTQRLIVLVKDGELEPEELETSYQRLLTDELQRPYADSVVLIRTGAATIRCDSYFSCATLWDASLVLDPRAAYERPPGLRD